MAAAHFPFTSDRILPISFRSNPYAGAVVGGERRVVAGGRGCTSVAP